MNRSSLQLLIAMAAVFIVISIPSLAGRLGEPEGKFWTGILSRNSADFNGYVGIVEEIRQGNFRARNLFTAEPHPPFQIRPLFLILGLIGRVVPNISSVALLEWGRAVTSFCLIWLLFLLCRKLFKTPSEQAFALVVLALGSGIGWLRLVPDPPDLRIVEFSTFLTLISPALYSTSLFLIVGILYLLADAFTKTEHRIRSSVIAGILALWLGFDRPFGLVSIAIAASVLLIITMAQTRKPNHLLLVLPLVVGVSVPLLYQLFAIRDIPVYAAWNRQHTLLTPEWDRTLSSFGFLIPLAAIGFIPFLRAQKSLAILIAAYAVSATLLSRLTFPFQERFVEGTPVCLGLFAAYGLATILRRVESSILKIILCFSVFIGILPSGFSAWTHDLEVIARHSPPQYLPEKVVDGMRKLASLAGPDEPILSTEASGNFIAAYSGRPVVLGQKIQTVAYFNKWKLVQRIYTSDPEDPALEELLKQSRTKWMFWGPEEAWLANRVFHPSRCPLLQQEYDNGFIRLYRFKAD